MKTNPSSKHRPSTLAVSPSGQPDRSNDWVPDAPADSGDGSRMNRIAARARQIYEARGGENGKALDDWLQAEREIDAQG